jgi:hypothetical protein
MWNLKIMFWRTFTCSTSKQTCTLLALRMCGEHGPQNKPAPCWPSECVENTVFKTCTLLAVRMCGEHRLQKNPKSWDPWSRVCIIKYLPSAVDHSCHQNHPRLDVVLAAHHPGQVSSSPVVSHIHPTVALFPCDQFPWVAQIMQDEMDQDPDQTEVLKARNNVTVSIACILLWLCAS